MYAMTLKPDIVIDPPVGLTVYSFDKQFILDLGVQMVREPLGEVATDLTKKCFNCSKTLPLLKMRNHVAYHLINGDVEGCNVCGYCGKSSCSTTLKKTRYIQKTATQYYKVESNCPYYVHYTKTPVI